MIDPWTFSLRVRHFLKQILLTNSAYFRFSEKVVTGITQISGGAFRVQVYSPYLVVNKTGLPFIVQSTRSTTPQYAARDTQPGAFDFDHSLMSTLTINNQMYSQSQLHLVSFHSMYQTPVNHHLQCCHTLMNEVTSSSSRLEIPIGLR